MTHREEIPTRSSLISRIKDKDDHDSWEEFAKLYSSLIYRFARKRGLNEIDADEIVQLTLIRISHAIEEFKYDRTIGSFKSFVLKTASWRISDHFRSNKRMVVLDPADLPQLDTQDENALYWEREWQRLILERAAERVKSRVNSKHFQVYELYKLRGATPKQVAQTVGVSTAQVYLITHRIAGQIKVEVDSLTNDPI